VNHTGN
jgi:hypothetical protein